MQVKKIVLAVAAIVAMPVTANAINLAPTTSGNTIYVAGATAQTPGLAKVLQSLCTNGATFVSLTDGKDLQSPPVAPVAKGWVCTTANNSSTTGVTGVLGTWAVLKQEGGSGDAFKAARTATKSSHLDLTNCTVSGSTGTCSIDGTTRESQIGLADVSGKIFNARNQLPTQTAAQKTTNTYEEVSTFSGQGFGVVASSALFAKLQADQGLTGNAVPSISKAQMASIMTGSMDAWEVLLDKNVATKPTEQLLLARRKPDSGTQVSAEIFFLGNPCAGKIGVLGAADAVLGALTSSGLDVGNHLTVKQESSSDAVLVDAASNSQYVIGVVSLENQESTTWKYLAIDGVHPGAKSEYYRTNLVNGTYGFQYESTLLKVTKAGTPSQVSNFVTAITAKLGNGSNLSTSYGLFSDPNSSDADYGVETNHFTRSGNECAPLTKFW